MSNLFSETDLIDDQLDEEADTFYDNVESKSNLDIIDRFDCQFKGDCSTKCNTCMLEYDCSACNHSGSYLCEFCTHKSKR